MRRRSRWIVGGILALPVVAACAGLMYQGIATRRDLARTPPPGSMVDIGGYRLHAWCTGSGSPTVVLESGLGGTSFSWAAVQRRIAEFTQVCSYDRAGFGYSDAGPARRTSDRIADELGRLLDAIHASGPVVLGAASFGGFDARILASRQPHRVAGLVLIDASHEDQQQRLAAAGLLPDVPRTLAFVARAASFGILRLRHQTLGLNPENADPAVRQFVRATMHRSSRYQALYAETEGWDESAAQVKATRRTLDIPVLVLTAGSWPPQGQQIHTELQRDQLTLSTNACQVIAKDAGHDIVGAAPELVVQAIRTVSEAVRSNVKLNC